MNPKIFTYDEPDLAGMILGTGYNRFGTHFGIDGLAKEKGSRLDILAVFAMVEGKGMFRNFITACQKEYQTICVWAVSNPMLAAALLRYGFAPETELQGGKEILDGFRWDRKQPA